MTEHHHDDQAPRTDAPTTPVTTGGSTDASTDQPTERVETQPTERIATQPTERIATLPTERPTGRPTESIATGAAGYARPDEPTQASTRPGTPEPATPAPRTESPDLPGTGVGVGAPSRPSGPGTLGQPGAPATPPSDGDAPSEPFAAPTPAWPSAGAQQPAAVPPLGPLAGWEEQPAPVATKPRSRWMPLVGTAAAAALLASVATAGLTGAFGAEAASATATSSIATIGRTSTDTVPVAGSTSDDPDWEKVAASVSASVVAIQVSTANGGGEGSGVIIDDAGHILTNNHVVSGARTVEVTLDDGRLYEATVVGTDPSTDLAIVRIDDAPDDLSPAALGDSDDVVVGAPVMAVGNPLGLANTVTTGIVSAVDRPVSASSSEAAGASDVVVTNAIQIDAAINPGNSGGPLFDAQGRVIGITSSIATLSSGGSQSGSIGLGFAIPVNLARGVGEQLIEDGTAEHAFLGVTLSDGTATADGVSRRGAVVEQVTADSPAAAAELQSGDVIVAIDGEPVGGSESLTAYVRERTAGDTAELTVVRDGEALAVTVTLATRETEVADEDLQDGSSGSGPDEGLLPGLPGSGVNPYDPFGDQG